MKTSQLLWALATPTACWGLRGERRQLTPTNTTTVAPTTTPFTNTTTSATGTFTGSATTTAAAYQLKTPPLDTPWTDKVGLNPWPEYPRPQLRRDKWQTLNGIWTWQSAGNASNFTSVPQGPLQMQTLVPSCIESALSGLQILDVSAMWYEKTFQVPSDWQGQSVKLHFEAVDYESTVFVNGQQAGFFRGGYFRNTIDVTRYLRFDGYNEVKVFVFDPTDLTGYVIPIGKQTKNPEHIFYRPCSGIWQTVWLESVPSNSISQLDIKAAADGTVKANVHTTGNGTGAVEIKVLGEDGSVIGTGSGTSDSEFTFTVSGVSAWTPDTPTLYNLTVTMGADTVSSYTGFRTISKGEIGGVMRPLLNGEWHFQFATLDQGYWPDGLHTPPSYEAMVYDLQELKKLGFNTVRKHVSQSAWKIVAFGRREFQAVQLTDTLFADQG